MTSSCCDQNVIMTTATSCRRRGYPAVVRMRGIGTRTAGLAPLRLIEWAAVLASPAVAFAALQVRRMAPVDMIDPWFYTAYAQHGGDLIVRNEAQGYNWTRLGFILPARLCYLAFGALGGFYTFRYLLALLAVIPAYLLLRSLFGRGAGAVAVVAILSSPVVLVAWGADYPDSAAVSYLVAGTCWLAFAAARPRSRTVLVIAAGVVLTLALHCQFVVAPLVLAAVIAYAIAGVLGKDVRRTLVDIGLLAAALVAVTAVLMLISKLWLGQWNIIGPNYRGYLALQKPGQLPHWHSANRQWALYVPYLLVPPAVIAAWMVLRLRRPRTAAPAIVVGISATLGGAAYYVIQFLGQTSTLEYHLYSSMLWSGTLLLSAVVIAEAGAPLLRRRLTGWVPAAMAGAAPLAWSLALPSPRFSMWPWGFVLAAVAVAAVAGTTLLRRSAVVAGVCTAAVVASLLVLTVVPATTPRLPDRTGLPLGEYSVILGHPNGPEVDYYAVASMVHTVAPPAEHPGDKLILWWPTPGRLNNFFSVVSAQYWSRHSALLPGMPDFTAIDGRKLRSYNPTHMMLLSLTGREFRAARAALRFAGWQTSVLRTVTLSHGGLQLDVQTIAVRRHNA